MVFNAKSQFSYCPLIWILSSRQSNNLVNKVHERSLRRIKKMKIPVLKLCFKITKLSQWPRKLRILMTEVYKIFKGEAPAIM